LGINVISITEPMAESIDSDLLEAVVEAVDSRFSKSLSQDVMRGMRESARRGHYPLSVVALGYKRQETREGKAKRYRLVPDKDWAPLVGRIFDLYVSSSLGAKGVAMRLNAEGLTTKSGKPWCTKSILHIISNPIYSGTLRMEFTKENARYLSPEDRSIVVEGMCEPLVDREVFQAAQRLREERAKEHPRHLASEYLLSGLLRCTRCGSRLYGVPAKSSRHFYYACRRYYESGKASCPFGLVNRDRLDSAVLEKVRDVLLSDTNLLILAEEVNRELGEDQGRLEEERSFAKARLRERRHQLVRLVDALEDGKVAPGALRERINTRQEEIERLQVTLDELKRDGGSLAAKRFDLARVRPYIESLKETLERAPLQTRRAVLKSFIERIDVARDELTIEFRLPTPQEGVASAGISPRVLGTENTGTPWWTTFEPAAESEDCPSGRTTRFVHTVPWATGRLHPRRWPASPKVG
jgi:site-specific DNA recombinase